MTDVTFNTRDHYEAYSLEQLAKDFGNSSHHLRAGPTDDDFGQVYTSSKWSLTGVKAAIGRGIAAVSPGLASFLDLGRHLERRAEKRAGGVMLVEEMVSRKLGGDMDGAKAILARLGYSAESSGIRGRDLANIQSAVEAELGRVEEANKQAAMAQVIEAGNQLVGGFLQADSTPGQLLDQISGFLTATGLDQFEDEPDSDYIRNRGEMRNIFRNALSATVLKDQDTAALGVLHENLTANRDLRSLQSGSFSFRLFQLRRNEEATSALPVSPFDETRLKLIGDIVDVLASVVAEALDVEAPSSPNTPSTRLLEICSIASRHGGSFAQVEAQLGEANGAAE